MISQTLNNQFQNDVDNLFTNEIKLGSYHAAPVKLEASCIIKAQTGLYIITDNN